MLRPYSGFVQSTFDIWPNFAAFLRVKCVYVIESVAWFLCYTTELVVLIFYIINLFFSVYEMHLQCGHCLCN